MPDSFFLGAISIAMLVMSVVAHEYAHGAVADALGDPTARLSGRLTLNPLKHLDPFGSVILPFLLVVSGLPAFGYARPVPYDPLLLSDRRRGSAMVAFAGPATNIVLSLLCALALRVGIVSIETVPGVLVASAGFINAILALFNLIPIPPLDGHWIVGTLGGVTGARLMAAARSMQLPLLLVALVLVVPILGDVAYMIFSALAGI
ncbi:MAG: site-2 protease family protein [Patescibacteria group bacterium]